MKAGDICDTSERTDSKLKHGMMRSAGYSGRISNKTQKQKKNNNTKNKIGHVDKSKQPREKIDTILA